MHNQIKKPYFDKKATSAIKGIALILMFLHHFFTFPEWWVEGISYPLIANFALYFRKPLKMCVPVFCFITGYFYFFNKNHTYKYSLKKIIDLLITYWCVFFVFSSIAIVFVGYEYSIAEFIFECFAFKNSTMIFCWYVYFYITFMLILPLITKIMSKNVHFDLLISFVVLPILLRTSQYFTSNEIFSLIISTLNTWLPKVLLGYIFASYGLFEKIEKVNKYFIKNEKINAIFLVIALLISLAGRYIEPMLTVSFTRLPSVYVNMDILYAPIFIYSYINLFKEIKLKLLKDVIYQVGNYSLLMWFVSCAFYNNCKEIFQPILYFPKNPLLVLIWGLLLCFSIAYIFNIITSYITKSFHGIFKETES